MNIDAMKVKLLLADRAMTQSSLAAACGTQRQNMSMILSRERCSPVTAGKIARALGVSVRDILKGVA